MNERAPTESLLPPGVTREVRDTTAELRFDTPDLEDAYRALTRADTEAGDERWVRVSRYLYDHWKALLERERLFTLLLTLQELSRQRRDPILTLDDLAGNMGWSVPTVRRQIVERYHDTAGYASDGWRAFRLYVDIREARSWRRPGTEPYQFAVLRGEVLHPKHRAELGDWTSRFARQRAFLFEEGAQGSQAETLETVGLPPIRAHGSQPESQTETHATVSGPSVVRQGSQFESPPPPAPPSPTPAMPACMRGREPQIEDPEAASLADPGHARRLLGEAGVPPDLARYLTSTAEKAYWAARWGTWFPSIRHRVRKPRSFLARRIEEAAAGVEAARIPPGEWYDQLEREAQRAKSIERTAAVVAPRPDPFVAQKQAPRPETATVVQPEAVSAWERLRGAAGELPAAMLSAATAVLLEGETLTVELPAANAEVLRRYRSRLLELARSAQPGLIELRFVPLKGGR